MAKPPVRRRSLSQNRIKKFHEKKGSRTKKCHEKKGSPTKKCQEKRGRRLKPQPRGKSFENDCKSKSIVITKAKRAFFPWPTRREQVPEIKKISVGSKPKKLKSKRTSLVSSGTGKTSQSTNSSHSQLPQVNPNNSFQFYDDIECWIGSDVKDCTSGLSRGSSVHRNSSACVQNASTRSKRSQIASNEKTNKTCDTEENVIPMTEKVDTDASKFAKLQPTLLPTEKVKKLSVDTIEGRMSVRKHSYNSIASHSTSKGTAADHGHGCLYWAEHSSTRSTVTLDIPASELQIQRTRSRQDHSSTVLDSLDDDPSSFSNSDTLTTEYEHPAFCATEYDWTDDDLSTSIVSMDAASFRARMANQEKMKKLALLNLQQSSQDAQRMGKTTHAPTQDDSRIIPKHNIVFCAPKTMTSKEKDDISIGATSFRERMANQTKKHLWKISRSKLQSSNEAIQNMHVVMEDDDSAIDSTTDSKNESVNDACTKVKPKEGDDNSFDSASFRERVANRAKKHSEQVPLPKLQSSNNQATRRGQKSTNDRTPDDSLKTARHGRPHNPLMTMQLKEKDDNSSWQKLSKPSRFQNREENIHNNQVQSLIGKSTLNTTEVYRCNDELETHDSLGMSAQDKNSSMSNETTKTSPRNGYVETQDDGGCVFLNGMETNYPVCAKCKTPIVDAPEKLNAEDSVLLFHKECLIHAKCARCQASILLNELPKEGELVLHKDCPLKTRSPRWKLFG